MWSIVFNKRKISITGGSCNELYNVFSNYNFCSTIFSELFRISFPIFAKSRLSSKDIRELQLADIVVQTLYRANKKSCPNPQKNEVELSVVDKIAMEYYQHLSNSNLFVNMGATIKQMDNDF
jgi:hypothetical protein